MEAAEAMADEAEKKRHRTNVIIGVLSIVVAVLSTAVPYY
jgi:hypothetical protein